jgi:hypothetical protein
VQAVGKIGRFLETAEQATTTIGYFGFSYRNRRLKRMSKSAIVRHERGERRKDYETYLFANRKYVSKRWG